MPKFRVEYDVRATYYEEVEAVSQEAAWEAAAMFCREHMEPPHGSEWASFDDCQVWSVEAVNGETTNDPE